MKNLLTSAQLLDIEKHIEEIDQSLDILDPSNAIEAQEIERRTLILESYVALLESSGDQPHLSLVR